MLGVLPTLEAKKYLYCCSVLAFMVSQLNYCHVCSFHPKINQSFSLCQSSFPHPGFFDGLLHDFSVKSKHFSFGAKTFLDLPTGLLHPGPPSGSPALHTTAWSNYSQLFI